MNDPQRLLEELSALEGERRRILAKLHYQKVLCGETNPADLAELDRVKRKIHGLQLDVAQADPNRLPF